MSHLAEQATQGLRLRRTSTHAVLLFVKRLVAARHDHRVVLTRRISMGGGHGHRRRRRHRHRCRCKYRGRCKHMFWSVSQHTRSCWYVTKLNRHYDLTRSTITRNRVKSSYKHLLREVHSQMCVACIDILVAQDQFVFLVALTLSLSECCLIR